jgi:hypothetical protein
VLRWRQTADGVARIVFVLNRLALLVVLALLESKGRKRGVVLECGSAADWLREDLDATLHPYLARGDNRTRRRT